MPRRVQPKGEWELKPWAKCYLSQAVPGLAQVCPRLVPNTWAKCGIFWDVSQSRFVCKCLALGPNMFPNKNIYIYQYIIHICLYMFAGGTLPMSFPSAGGSPRVYRGDKQQTCKHANTPAQPKGDRPYFAFRRRISGWALARRRSTGTTGAVRPCAGSRRRGRQIGLPTGMRIR
jgi:hypothetical protein